MIINSFASNYYKKTNILEKFISFAINFLR